MLQQSPSPTPLSGPIEDAIRNRQVQIVFNTTDGQKAVSDSKSLRRATLMQKVPYYTTMAGAGAVAEAIAALKAGSLEVRPLQGHPSAQAPLLRP